MLIEEVGNLIANSGHGTLGVDIFLYQMPDTPDTCIALREYGGGEPSYSHTYVDPSYEVPRFQMLARAPAIPDARLLAHQVWVTLQSVRNVTLDGTFYLRLQPLQSPFMIERDNNDRWVAGANFEAMKEVSSG
jgi:hypothetical protein